MTDKLPRDMTENELRYHCAALTSALSLLKIAVDREGWPAGWGLIRKEVEIVLGTNQQSARCAECNCDNPPDGCNWIQKHGEA